MREIKFRGLAIESITWEYGDLIRDKNNDCFIHFYDCNGFECSYEVYPETVSQYTGLKDRNGKEIYEGDIVTYTIKGSNKKYKTIMKYNEEHGAFLFGIYEGVKMPCGKKTRMNKYTRKSVANVEILGNIYEDKHWLEGEK